jgi:predicted outer membrane protein
MIEHTNAEPTDSIEQGSLSRRKVLLSAATAGLGVATLGISGLAQAGLGQASKTPHQPEADTGHDYPMPAPQAKTERDFRLGVVGPATLSLLTSQIAVDKASDAGVLEFANFELREAIGVTMVLKDLGTPTPPMDATSRAILQKIKSLPKGDEFDKTYIKAQLANHEFLRDLATVYLKNSEGHASMAEKHGRHLATLTLGAFKEHVVHCKNLHKSLGA